MSIQSEINRISGNVSDALDAIEDKGVTIPSGANSDDLADLIAQITGGGGVGGITQDEDGYLVLSPDRPPDTPIFITKTITENGTYDAEDDEADGYSSVTVDVSGGSFTPKKDGKFHLYFNLLNDSLKTVKFRATETASHLESIVDWGDGTTQALASTNEHTYSKTGLYEVTVSNGVLRPFSELGTEGFLYASTLVGAEYNTAGSGSFASYLFYSYTPSLRWVYYDDDSMTATSASYFNSTHEENHALQYCRLDPNLEYFGTNMFSNCRSLAAIEIPTGVADIPNYSFQYCRALQTVTIPSGVTSIGNYAFRYCSNIKEYHIKPLTPPTLGGTSAFYVGSGVVIYVPSASLSSYQSASNWSSYASYMQGE